ncbi:MAG TPA: recombinase RecT [Sideroxyarcus sp.]|nr:recombinase RecT [Sideroxyarcus sp.]
MEQATAVQEQQQQDVQDVQKFEIVESNKASSLALITNKDNMERVESLARAMASSKVTVPKHLQGNEGDCTAIVLQSMNWGMNPFAVAQKTHIVNGALGYEAQLVNAVVQTSGAIKGRFHYQYEGEGSKMKCRVGAVIAGESEITWGEWLENGEVTTRNSPLWKTNPKQQLGYLQVKNWARAYCPSAILGVYTTDELQDVPMKDLNDAPKPRSGAAVAQAAQEATVVLDAEQEERRKKLCADLYLAAEAGTDKFLAAWKAMGKANKDDAYLVGLPEYNRLLAIAQAVVVNQDAE